MTDEDRRQALDWLLQRADDMGDHVLYGQVEAATEIVFPGSMPDPDPRLVEDPERVAAYLEEYAGLEEAKTERRDDAMVTDCREAAGMVHNAIRSAAAPAPAM